VRLPVLYECMDWDGMVSVRSCDSVADGMNTVRSIHPACESRHDLQSNAKDDSANYRLRHDPIKDRHCYLKHALNRNAYP